MERDCSKYQNPIEVSKGRRKMLSVITAAALGLAKLRSDALPSHDTSVPIETIEIVLDGQATEDELASKCNARELTLDRDLHISELLEEIIIRQDNSRNTSDPLPSGLSLETAKSVVWIAADKMNIEELPINIPRVFSRQNLTYLRNMNIRILQPTEALRQVHAIAQDLLPPSFFAPLCDRPTIIFDVLGRVDDTRRDPFAVDLELGDRFITYTQGGSFGNSFNQRNIVLNADFTELRGEEQTRYTEWAIGTVVHEYLHARQAQKPRVSVTYYGNKPLDNSYLLDSYTADMLQILGIIYKDKKGSRIGHIDRLMELMLRAGYVKRVLTDKGTNSYKDTDYLGYGVMGHDLKYTASLMEFLPVAGKIYLQGKSEFIRLYGGVFGVKPAKDMYDYIKNTFFEGREFKSRELRGITVALVERWESERSK